MKWLIPKWLMSTFKKDRSLKIKDNNLFQLSYEDAYESLLYEIGSNTDESLYLLSSLSDVYKKV